jgi:hypothetical protein
VLPCRTADGKVIPPEPGTARLVAWGSDKAFSLNINTRPDPVSPVTVPPTV